MTFDIRDSVVLITSADAENRAFGTGFIIYSDAQAAAYLVTCAHVVRDVGGPEKTTAEGHAATVVASGVNGFPDLAVLRVNGLSRARPLRLQAQAHEGDAFLTDGFQTFGQKHLHRPIRGVLGAQIALVDKGQPAQVRAWDLSIIGEFDLQPGYSGSPIVLEKTGAVVGVASHTVGQKKGIAISTDNLPKIWPAAPASLFDPLTVPIASEKPLGFSEVKQKVLQKRLTILIAQYKAAMGQYNLQLSAADRVILEQQGNDLEQQIVALEGQLATLTI